MGRTVERHQCELFATFGDLRMLMRDVEAKRSLKFAAAGMFDADEIRLLASLACDDTTPTPGAAFLAVGRDGTVRTMEVPRRKGATRYAVDQIANPESVVIRPGGPAGDAVLLAGQIGTASDHPASLSLFAAFEKVVKRRFVKVKSYWIGPEAERILDAGGRLVATLKSPTEYDLKR